MANALPAFGSLGVMEDDRAQDTHFPRGRMVPKPADRPGVRGSQSPLTAPKAPLLPGDAGEGRWPCAARGNVMVGERKSNVSVRKMTDGKEDVL